MYNCTIKMNIVIDTSVIIAVLTNEKHKRELIEMTSGADLIAPPSLYWELGNAFSALLKRQRILPSQVRNALRSFSRITIRYREIGLEGALKLCSRYGLYAYDAYFIACAQKYNIPLLTLDKTMIRIAKETGVEVREVQP